MGFFSLLAGNSKSVEKVIDAGISGLDKLIFTEEEKADYNRKLQELHLEFIKIAATESTTQSVSRRMICIPVVYTWLALVVLNVALTVFIPELDATTILETISYMNTPALASIGFYVGRHLVADFKKK